jgi:nucleoid DNA-binding protein
MADNKQAAAPKAKPMTKSKVYDELATKTKLTRKQVSDVFDALLALMKQELGKKGPGVFSLPGMLKVRRKHVPPTKARPGRNPATGEPMTIKAKPARNVVKAQVLKSLKELVK